MTTWVALLRAVNVGGTTKLPMEQLRTICTAAGMRNVRTYIASGNVVLDSDLDEAGVRAAIEDGIEQAYGKRIPVLVRSGAELSQVAAANPFPHAAGNRLVMLFTEAEPSLAGLRHQQGEEIGLGRREIYIHYGDGMAQSKLSLAAMKDGTGRNLNTIVRLVEMAAAASAA